MPTVSQNIILFIEPNDDACFTSSKIGHSYMNRFAIDEDAGLDFLNIMKIKKTSFKLSLPQRPENISVGSPFVRQLKGKDFVIEHQL